MSRSPAEGDIQKKHKVFCGIFFCWCFQVECIFVPAARSAGAAADAISASAGTASQAALAARREGTEGEQQGERPEGGPLEKAWREVHRVSPG